MASWRHPLQLSSRPRGATHVSEGGAPLATSRHRQVLISRFAAERPPARPFAPPARERRTPRPPLENRSLTWTSGSRRLSCNEVYKAGRPSGRPGGSPPVNALRATGLVFGAL